MRQHGRVDVVVEKRPEVRPETELMEPGADKFDVRIGNWLGHIKFDSKLMAIAQRVAAETAVPKPVLAGCYFIIGCGAMFEMLSRGPVRPPAWVRQIRKVAKCRGCGGTS
jgi:hypothetical protein